MFRQLHLCQAAWSLSSDSFPFGSDSAARPDLCLTAVSVRVTATVFCAVSAGEPAETHTDL